jgi:hypothetical protein
VGINRAVHPHHHSFIQFSKNHKSLFFQYQVSKANQSRNYSKAKAETVFGAGRSFVVYFLFGGGFCSTVFKSD